MLQQLPPQLIDSHVHTDDDRFAGDIEGVLHNAREANVIAQIVPAISRRLWPRVRSVCNDHKDLFACYGLHPCFSAEHTVQHLDELASWLALERPVAVGECGLDYAIEDADKSFQHQLFIAQLALAREFNLPIVVHARKAVEDVIDLIKASGHRKGLIHSFNGSEQQALKLIELGFKFSFGGAITYDRASKLRSLVATLPLDSILLETDAPDQPDANHSGQRNEPAYLADVWASVCALREEDAAQIAATTSQNAIDLFNLKIKLAKPKKSKTKTPSKENG